MGRQAGCCAPCGPAVPLRRVPRPRRPPRPVARPFPQQAKLSERNVIELVNKLKQLGLLGDELLHTSNGREYITRQQVTAEVAAAVDEAGGRIPLVIYCFRGSDACDPGLSDACDPGLCGGSMKIVDFNLCRVAGLDTVPHVKAGRAWVRAPCHSAVPPEADSF